jgi:alpha-tubulin suppressor-like RCC1 family protein
VGQLGNGTLDDSPVPVAVLTELQFVSLVAGEFHACGRVRDGSVWCWGRNDRGQLGVPLESEGGVAFSPTPVQVTGGLSFVSLDAGFEHNCGITDGDVTYCWGRGIEGQLGDGIQTTSSVPVPVAGGLPFASVSAGLGHSCAVTTAGDAHCWGLDNGAFGNGSNPLFQSLIPVPAANGMELASIHAGTLFTCGVNPNDEAFCWGLEAGDGELGLGVPQDAALGFPVIEVPMPVVGDLNFESFVVTKNNVWQGHTCGLTQSGEAFCWGTNATGALGAPSPDEICDGVFGRLFPCSSSPLRVSGNVRFAGISVGAAFNNKNHTCAATRGGDIYCWGANEFGQLGAPSTESCTVPDFGDIPCSTEPVLVSIPRGNPISL